MATRSDVVRVLISDLPDLQADIVARLVSEQPDMVLVVGREVHEEVGADHLAADVIVMSPRPDADDGRARSLLRTSTRAGLLAIDAARGDILGVVVVSDERAWPDRIIAAIRSAAPERSPRHRKQSS